jgi:hypothetical protein
VFISAEGKNNVSNGQEASSGDQRTVVAPTKINGSRGEPTQDQLAFGQFGNEEIAAVHIGGNVQGAVGC